MVIALCIARYSSASFFPGDVSGVAASAFSLANNISVMSMIGYGEYYRAPYNIAWREVTRSVCHRDNVQRRLLVPNDFVQRPTPSQGEHASNVRPIQFQTLVDREE